LIEMGTFVAILIGTILAGSLVAQPAPAWPLSIITMLLAIMGLACALFIPQTPAISPALTLNFNPFAATLANLRLARQSRPIFLSLLGISWLWMFGAIFLTQFGSFARDVLNAPPAIATALLVIFSLGIAIGSLLCEKLSSGKIEIGLVPFGSIGMTIFSFDMCLAATAPTLKAQFSDHAIFLSLFSAWASIRLAGDLFFCALFSGFYSVPLYAFIQQRALNEERSRIIAANNILNAFFMIGSAILSIVVLTVFKASLVTLFFIVSFLNACVAIYIYCLVPEFLLRFVAWCLAHTMYRIKKVNIKALPQEGPAVIVSNHVSFVDALIIMGMSPRPLRFVMDHKIFAVPFLSWFFRTARAIPIASAKDRVDLLNAAYDEISVALKNNELVCIFPEGRITDTGELYPFKRGVERILARDNVPVIPLALQGLWGSFFSRAYGGKAFNGWRGFFNKIGVNIGDSIKFECHENKESEKIDIPALLQEKIKILRGDWK